MITRDFTPVKPDPAPLFHIAKMWNTEPKRLLMVGDDKNDIECGIAAGAGIISFLFMSAIQIYYSFVY